MALATHAGTVVASAPTLNGSAPATLPARKGLTTADVRFRSTVALGCLIPILSFALSMVGGKLATYAATQEGNAAVVLFTLAGFFLALVCCVLAVSLEHLAWAIGDLTRSPAWSSWLLAVSFDLALVLGEFCQVYGQQAGVAAVVWGIMATVCVFSMFLNCWAFLNAPKSEARKHAKAASNAPSTPANASQPAAPAKRARKSKAAPVTP